MSPGDWVSALHLTPMPSTLSTYAMISRRKQCFCNSIVSGNGKN